MSIIYQTTIGVLRDRITALESELKAAEAEIAKRVPFDVVQGKMDKCYSNGCEYGKHSSRCTPENCPLIPKAQP